MSGSGARLATILEMNPLIRQHLEASLAVMQEDPCQSTKGGFGHVIFVWYFYIALLII